MMSGYVPGYEVLSRAPRLGAGVDGNIQCEEVTTLAPGRYRWGYIFFAAALVATALGLFRGEHLGVLDKAITLCLECLGLR